MIIIGDKIKLIQKISNFDKIGDIFEFLTDVEKDIENEIKEISIEQREITSELVKWIYDDILKSVKDSYGLSDEASLKLYHHLWIYTHGIATLFATGMCSFSDEEISNMLTEVFVSLLKNIKAGADNDKN